jgi:hypothetical protein
VPCIGGIGGLRVADRVEMIGEGAPGFGMVWFQLDRAPEGRDRLVAPPGARERARE